MLGLACIIAEARLGGVLAAPRPAPSTGWGGARHALGLQRPLRGGHGRRSPQVPALSSSGREPSLPAVSVAPHKLSPLTPRRATCLSRASASAWRSWPPWRRVARPLPEWRDGPAPPRALPLHPVSACISARSGYAPSPQPVAPVRRPSLENRHPPCSAWTAAPSRAPSAWPL